MQPKLEATPPPATAGMAMHVGRPSSGVIVLPAAAAASCSSISRPGEPVTSTASGGTAASDSGA
jgi:hypothetical protein